MLTCLQIKRIYDHIFANEKKKISESDGLCIRLPLLSPFCHCHHHDHELKGDIENENDQDIDNDSYIHTFHIQKKNNK